MRSLGIEGVKRSRRVKTTKPDPTVARHPDLVKRVFSSTAPNQLWVTDFTFVPTWSGVAYVCFIIDAYSRMIVGWRVASHMKTKTVLDAIEMARWSRGKHLPGLRCHSDAGSQGGFNRSSQHFKIMEVCDGSSSTASRSCDSTEDEVAGFAVTSARTRRLFWFEIRKGLIPGQAAILVGVSPPVGQGWFHNVGACRLLI